MSSALQAQAGAAPAGKNPRNSRVWLFDLDNTLHNASASSFKGINERMTNYIVERLGLAPDEADALRRHYWLRYGATLLGLVRHHGVKGHHFLHETHVLPGLEAAVRSHPHDLAALRRLPGRKIMLTNAPAHYTARVLGVLGIGDVFDEVVSIEGMRMFGHWRPKPDTRMLRRLAARLRVHPSRCVLVEDTLEHQKAARSVGMQTVWMQRWMRAATWGISASTRASMCPPYVDRRVRRLSRLCKG